MARAIVVFEDMDPFGAGVPSAHCGAAFVKKFGVPESFDPCGLIALVEAELALGWVWGRWQKLATETMEIAKNHSKLVSGVALPSGFSEFRMPIKDDPKDLYLVELAATEVMEACYVLGERITKATGLLHDYSGGKIWKDIKSAPASGSSAVPRNLLSRFEEANPTVGSTVSANIQSLIIQRGLRTHDSHYYMHAELDPDEIVFQDVPAYSVHPVSSKFTAHELQAQVFYFLAFARWWSPITKLMIESS